MRRSLSSCALLLGTTLLPAQGTSPTPTTPTPPAVAAPAAAADLAASKQRLQQALQKTAGIADTAFTAEWGQDQPDKSLPPSFAGSGKVTGSWHRDRLHVAFDGEQQNEVVATGRGQLARDAKTEWKLRQRRFADGNLTGFVPDPGLALRQLATWDLAVTRRAVGSLDDRPVEIVSVTLSPEQVGEAAWTGVIDDRMVTSSVAALLGQMRRAGGPPKVLPPDASVDLVVWLDPATDLVQQLQFRCWSKTNVMRGGPNVVMAQGGGVVQVQVQPAQKEAAEEEPAKGAVPTDGSVLDDKGLPVRSRKDTMVTDYSLRLRDHGKKPAPPLDDAQKRLLGL